MVSFAVFSSSRHMFFITALLYGFLPSLCCFDFFHSFFPSYLSSFFFSFSPHLPDPRRGAGGQKSLHFLKSQTFILKDFSWKYKEGKKNPPPTWEWIGVNSVPASACGLPGLAASPSSEQQLSGHGHTWRLVLLQVSAAWACPGFSSVWYSRISALRLKPEHLTWI